MCFPLQNMIECKYSEQFNGNVVFEGSIDCAKAAIANAFALYSATSFVLRK